MNTVEVRYNMFPFLSIDEQMKRETASAYKFKEAGMYFCFGCAYSDNIINELQKKMKDKSQFKLQEVWIEQDSSGDDDVCKIELIVVLDKPKPCIERNQIVEELRREFEEISDGYRVDHERQLQVYDYVVALNEAESKG